MPKISVIIPAYNQAQYLGETIESVLRQTVPAHEVIVVNDGSPDNTSEIAKKYPVILLEKPNGGLASARNYGIRHASGEYIMCLDSDDILRKGSIEEYSRLITPNVIAQCGIMYFGSENAIFRPPGANLESLLKTNSIYCNSVFPKWAWEKAGGYDESETMRLGLEDWLFWIELAYLGLQVVTSDYIALLYRRHSGAMTKQTTHRNWNIICDYMQKKLEDTHSLTFTARRI